MSFKTLQNDNYKILEAKTVPGTDLIDNQASRDGYFL